MSLVWIANMLLSPQLYLLNQSRADLLKKLHLIFSVALKGCEHTSTINSSCRHEGAESGACISKNNNMVGIAVAMAGSDKRIISIHQPFTCIACCLPEGFLGKSQHILKSGCQDSEFYRATWDFLHEAGLWHGKVWSWRKRGEILPECAVIKAVLDGSGEAIRCLTSFPDIIPHKEHGSHLCQLPYLDSLINLPNRYLLEKRMQHAISDAYRTGDAIAVIFINLDNLKTINELFGNVVGDEVLKICAQRIIDCCKARGAVARLSGAGFVLMLTNLTSEEHAKTTAVLVAEQIAEVLAHSVMLRMYETVLLPSIGIATYPTDADNAIELIRHANMAMCHVKSTGRNNYKFFSPHMNVAAMRRFEMNSLLHLAINRMEFALHYQPQVDNSGKIVGAEALLRWHSPVLGNVSPAEFITLAEESGAILSIGEWVIRTACLQRKDWFDRGLCVDAFYIAVNVSPCQFQCSDFVEKITSIIHDVGVLAQQIDIEITEGVLMQDTVDAKQKLFELKAHGFRISVDDFGTGYSSLAYLKHFPIDVLKIDRSFVQDIGSSCNDEAISRTIISLAGNLGIKTVAEGVETIEQVQFLQSHGCDAYQGYYFSEPVSALKMTSLLQG